MKIGTYYYPEQWPREQWERDFDNIAAMGLQIVHMAEFAWYEMEPRPGEFHFEWLDTCIDMCKQRKLDVILCTPTAAPPIWLAQNAQTLPMDEHGTRVRFGGRRHYSPTSPAFREATTRIVTAMAERYGQHPSIIGWQIDNELGSDFHDQSEHSHKAFQSWLQRKYGSIDALNKAWGGQFWNTYYTDFSQVQLTPKGTIGYTNPHHALDSQRFWSWAFADFSKLQADILKPRVGERFITTNFMSLHQTCNPADFLGQYSLFSWDSYPVTGWDKNVVDESFRVADPSGISLMHDLMASYTGRWGLMEIQPGQINWSGVPVLVYPGAVRLWLWTAIAHGAEFITTYRYRQPRFGVELFHHALVGTDGVTPTPGGREFIQVIDELKRLEAPKTAAAVATAATAATGAATPAAPAASPAPGKAPKAAAPPAPLPSVGLLFDFEQLWYYTTLPHARRWDQRAWLTQWYASLAHLGLRVNIVHPNQPWPDHMAMLVAPGVQMVDDALIRQFDDYANSGGNLVLTCRTGLMDRNGQLFEGPTAKPILPLIGGSIEAYDVLPDDMHGIIEMDTVKYKWGAWGDLLYAESGTKVVAKYADQFYAGGAAVIGRKHGKGTVVYCGAYAEPAFTSALIDRIATNQKIPSANLPPRVQLLQRGRFKIALNYQLTPFDAPAPRGAKLIVGTRKVDPVSVAVWEE